MRFLIINTTLLFVCSCGLLDTNKQGSNPVFIAAEEAQFLKDGGLRSKINDFNTKIVAAKYVESFLIEKKLLSKSTKKRVNQFCDKGFGTPKGGRRRGGGTLRLYPPMAVLGEREPI